MGRASFCNSLEVRQETVCSNQLANGVVGFAAGRLWRVRITADEMTEEHSFDQARNLFAEKPDDDGQCEAAEDQRCCRRDQILPNENQRRQRKLDSHKHQDQVDFPFDDRQPRAAGLGFVAVLFSEETKHVSLLRVMKRLLYFIRRFARDIGAIPLNDCNYACFSYSRRIYFALTTIGDGPVSAWLLEGSRCESGAAPPAVIELLAQ